MDPRLLFYLQAFSVLAFASALFGLLRGVS